MGTLIDPLLYQNNRTLTLRFPNQDGPDADLVVEELHAREAISRDFEYELELLSRNARIPLKAVMGRLVSVELATHDGGPGTQPRWFTGYVTHFLHRGTDGGYARYRATLSPWSSLLKRRQDNRIFQDLSFPDTLNEIFAMYRKFARYDFRLSTVYPAETFRVQYEESDYNYFNRRCEEKGWIYWFEHDRDGHTLVISDDSCTSDPIPAPQMVRYHGCSYPDKHDHIDHWESQRELAPARVCLRSFDFKQPNRRLEADMDSANEQGDVPCEEVYEFAGAHAFGDARGGDHMARMRMEEIEARAKGFQGGGNCRRLQPGRSFTLIGHYDCDASKPEDSEFFLVAIEHHAHNNYLNDGDDGPVYRNTLTALRKRIPYRVGRGHNSRRVRMPGPQTATVVGPPGEEIWCDEYGRVRVQFPWDRNDYNDDRASCWIRVSNPMGGGQMGGMFLPRVGQEVIVDFLNGNPDHPVIVGRLYNAGNMPPWPLPDAKNQMGLYSKSVGGGYDNANALRFDDTPGSEELWMHAEKDQRLEVENDESHWVGQDRAKTVDRDEISHIQRDRTETVDRNEVITVHQDRRERVDHDEIVSIGDNRTEDVGRNETIEIGQDQTVSIGQNQNLNVGANRSKTVRKNEKSNIGKSWTVKVGKMKTETIGMASMQNVGMAKMVNVGTVYSLNVGMLRNTIVGMTENTRIGKKYSMAVGGKAGSHIEMDKDSITLRVGGAILQLRADGTIGITGRSINITAQGDDVTINGEHVWLNPVGGAAEVEPATEPAASTADIPGNAFGAAVEKSGGALDTAQALAKAAVQVAALTGKGGAVAQALGAVSAAGGLLDGETTTRSEPEIIGIAGPVKVGRP